MVSPSTRHGPPRLLPHGELRGHARACRRGQLVAVRARSRPPQRQARGHLPSRLRRCLVLLYLSLKPNCVGIFVRSTTSNLGGCGVLYLRRSNSITHETRDSAASIKRLNAPQKPQFGRRSARDRCLPVSSPVFVADISQVRGNGNPRGGNGNIGILRPKVSGVTANERSLSVRLFVSHPVTHPPCNVIFLCIL